MSSASSSLSLPSSLDFPSSLSFPPSFLWGTATAAHQIEGGNDRNDFWAAELRPGTPFAEPSGAACDSFNRYPEDIEIVRSLGLQAYRFSLEWSRIETEPGEFSQAAISHYRSMVEQCHASGIEPVVTLHHFTNPLWFSRLGGWTNPQAPEHFERFCSAVLPILSDVRLICTINEPTVLSEAAHLLTDPPGQAHNPLIKQYLLEAHKRAVELLHAEGGHEVGITLALPAWVVLPGGEEAARAKQRVDEDFFFEQLRGDDFVGVQTYTTLVAGPEGIIEPDDSERQTLMGWRFTPEALGETVRRTAQATGCPIYVTENGIATNDDAERIEYVTRALESVSSAIADGVDVRGYFYWSLLDNFEWLRGYEPTFGIVGVDRATFTRTTKPSATWLGELSQRMRA